MFSGKISDIALQSGNYNEFERCFLEVLNAFAPIKKRLVRANEVPYMMKALRKAIANRSRLENQYLKINQKKVSWSIKKTK